MVIGLPKADAAVPAPAAPATKGRRPIRLEIAASKIDLLKLPRPPVKLPPSIVVPAIAEMRFEALTPMVLAGPVELLLKLASINIILARPAVEPGAVTLGLPVVPLTRPLTYPLDAWSRMDRAPIRALVPGGLGAGAAGVARGAGPRGRETAPPVDWAGRWRPTWESPRVTRWT